MFSVIKFFYICGVIGLGLAADPSPCCVNSKFTTKAKTLTTVLPAGSSAPVFTENRVLVDVDKVAQMERFDGTLYIYQADLNYVVQNYTTIRNFKTNTEYTYSTVNGRIYCNVNSTDISEEILTCVPSSLKWTETATVGYGTESAKVNSWNGMVGNFSWSMQTLVSDCTPVAYTRYGTDNDGSRVLETYAIFDMTQGALSSPNVFVIPHECATG